MSVHLWALLLFVLVVILRLSPCGVKMGLQQAAPGFTPLIPSHFNKNSRADLDWPDVSYCLFLSQ